MAKQIKSMKSATDGSKTMVAAYDALGVSVTDANGNLRDSDTVYWELIDALGAVENETERDALAMALYIRTLKKQPEVMHDWNDTIWTVMIEKAIVPVRVCGGHPENPLQQARLKAGVAQYQIAEELSRDIRTIHRYESGELFPDWNELLKMKLRYSCEFADLFPEKFR